MDAGVGALAGDLLLLLWDAARRRRRPTCVQGTWDRAAGKGGGMEEEEMVGRGEKESVTVLLIGRLNIARNTRNDFVKPYSGQL